MGVSATADPGGRWRRPCFCLRGESSVVKQFQKQTEPRAVSHPGHALTARWMPHGQAGRQAHTARGGARRSPPTRGRCGDWDTDTGKLAVERQSKLRSFCPPMGGALCSTALAPTAPH